MKTTQAESHRAEALLAQTFARLDTIALGTAVGALLGAGVCVATIFLLVKGGEQIGPNLALLGQYFPGYRVTWTGSAIGLGYGFVAGFAAGWLLAFVRNLSITLYLQAVKLKAVLASFRTFFDSM